MDVIAQLTKEVEEMEDNSIIEDILDGASDINEISPDHRMYVGASIMQKYPNGEIPEHILQKVADKLGVESVGIKCSTNYAMWQLGRSIDEMILEAEANLAALKLRKCKK